MVKKTGLTLAVMAVLWWVAELPTINLVVSKLLILGIALGVIATVFRWSFFLLAFILLNVGLYLTLSGRFHGAELFGFLVYVCLLFGVAEIAISMYRNTNEKDAL